MVRQRLGQLPEPAVVIELVEREPPTGVGAPVRAERLDVGLGVVLESGLAVGETVN